MNWILGIICSFKGHIPEKFLTETDFSIKTKRCKRCHVPLGLGHWKGFHCSPPGASDEEWVMYLEQEWQKIRDSV